VLSKNFVEQVKSLRINYDAVVELPSANSKLPYFMDSKRTGPNPKPTQPPPKGARVTNANYADIVKGLSKGDKPVV